MATIDPAIIYAITSQRPTAADLAAKYASTWPQIAGNAERAAEYIERGQVWRSGSQIAIANGETTEQWIAGKSNYSNGERCTHAGNHCTCSEAAISDPKFGRLCSHRIAVLMYKRLQAAAAEALIALFRYLDTLDADGRIVLEIERHYRNHAEDRKMIRRITRGPGGQGPRVDESGILEIDDQTLAAVMQATARTLSGGAPQKRAGYTYSYILAAIPPAIPGDELADLRGVDAVALDAAEDRKARLRAEGRALERQLQSAA